MSDDKIKILGIAPYEGMKAMMQRLSSHRTDIDLTVFVGDLDEGVEIAKRNLNRNYDVIISRGGTAELIGEITNTPLVEIQLSVYDILRAIKLAENYSDRYAVVGYPSITGSAQLLCDLLQYDIDIFTIHNIDEVEHILADLKNQGYRMILCDMITKTTAQKLGLNAILITSGDESIESAFDQAVKLYRSYVHIKEDNLILQNIIHGQDRQIYVYTFDKKLIFSSAKQNDTPFLTGFIEKHFEEFTQIESKKMTKTCGEILYSIIGQNISNYSQNAIAFYIDKAPILPSKGKYGITYSNKNEVKDFFFNSFYSVSRPTAESEENVLKMSLSQYPIMILGETGTGKSQVARMVYTQSSVSHNPFITIDCGRVNEKTWTFLLNHHNSPLTDTENTLFVKDLHTLAPRRAEQFLSAILDMNVHKHNRMIFTCATQTNTNNHSLIAEYVNQMTCLKIHIKPLRERVHDIPKLSSLYLNTLNLNFDKQIIGFDQKALVLLETYDWPINYTQFKRVLEEMAIVTTTPYISVDTVKSILNKETHPLHSTPETTCQNNSDDTSIPYVVDTNLSLNELNKDIVALYVKHSGGNHSQAAKKLGISRTTLWRYLK